MRSAVLLAVSLLLAAFPTSSNAAAAGQSVATSDNAAMSCTKFTQRGSKFDGMGVDNDCAEDVNVLIAVYDRYGYYLVNIWHGTHPGSHAITGIPEYEDDDQLYFQPDKYGFTQYYAACFEHVRTCNRAIDCMMTQGLDDGGVRKIVDLMSAAKECRIALFGGKPA